MKIAWRYQDLPKTDSSSSAPSPPSSSSFKKVGAVANAQSSYCQVFDMTKNMSQELIQACEIKSLDFSQLKDGNQLQIIKKLTKNK